MRKLLIPLLIAGLALLAILGCEEEVAVPEPDEPGPKVGSIEINVSPDEIEFTWVLFNSDKSLVTGAGDTLIADLEVGQYTVVWESAIGWITPETETDTLAEGTTIEFSGTYLEIPIETGTIVVAPTPDSINAPWVLSGPVSKTDSGDAVLEEMPIGVYTLNWQAVTGWVTPDFSSQTLTPGESVTFDGSFTEIEPGTIVVAPTPDSINAPWVLSGPVSKTDSGDAVLEEMPIGVYTLNWQEVTGWVTPDFSSQTLGSGETVTFDGSYTEFETGSIEINPTPESLNASWTLFGPEDRTGTGQAYLEDILVGEYTIIWGTVSGWETPAHETQVLDPEATVTFSCIYFGAGTIEIDISPDSIGSSWTLSSWFNPGPPQITGEADTTLYNMPVGEYKIVFTYVQGWITPVGGFSVVVYNNAITKIEGAYIEYFPPAAENSTILAGDFWMGSPVGECDHQDNELQRTVTLTRDYIMETTEVTQADFFDLMGFNPSPSSECPDCPVVNVSWYDAIHYCNAKSIADGLTPAYQYDSVWDVWRWVNADGWRLPKEAEWEYACRAGTQTPYHTGECLDADTEANFFGWNPCVGCPRRTYRNTSVAVGIFPPNSWGLYDMHGNVSEWCWDPFPEDKRVIRGGSFNLYGSYCRSARRDGLDPFTAMDSVGFRIVRWVD